ncbi:Cysteine desulfurase [compost metagenome]
MSIDGTRALSVLDHLADAAASAGSACHAGSDTPSAVLTAMGLSRERALGALRLSLGRWSTNDEVDRAADQIAAAARL